MGQERILAVFEAVAALEPASLSEVAAGCDLPSSTVHRTLGVLATSGWVRPIAPGRPRWAVTERVRALVRGPSADAVAMARPVVAALAAATGESAALWLADGDAVVAAAVSAPATALRVVLVDGDRVPAYACAPGKAVLSARSDAEVRLAAARGFRPLTMRTIGDAEQLLVELRATRATGIAVARDEEAEGVTSIACPAATGAVGIVGPTPRVEARLDELAALVSSAAAALAATATAPPSAAPQRIGR